MRLLIRIISRKKKDFYVNIAFIKRCVMEILDRTVCYSIKFLNVFKILKKNYLKS